MNESNLISNSERTPKERKEKAIRMGIASGEARREKKRIQDALRKALDGSYNIKDKKLGGYDALAISMITEALKGNVQAFKEIRDTIGEKPKETLELESTAITGIRVKFVDKSMPKNTVEKDPKIIGDYTPPSNTEE